MDKNSIKKFAVWSRVELIERVTQKTLAYGIEATKIIDENVDSINALQVCLDSGAKKVLIPSTSFMDFATVPPELMSAFQLIPYQNAEDAVFKALGVE